MIATLQFVVVRVPFLVALDGSPVRLTTVIDGPASIPERLGDAVSREVAWWGYRPDWRDFETMVHSLQVKSVAWAA